MKKTIDGVTYKRRKEHTPCEKCVANPGDELCEALNTFDGHVQPCYHAWKKLKLKVGSKLKVEGERYVAVPAKVARGGGCVGCDALLNAGLCNKIKRATEQKFNGDCCDFTADVIWTKLVEVADPIPVQRETTIKVTNVLDVADAVPDVTPIGQQLKAALDGWISWAGGECPFQTECRVEVIFRDGSRDMARAFYYEWDHTDHPKDIVAYRVIEEAKPKVQTVMVSFQFPAALDADKVQLYVENIVRHAVNGTPRDSEAHTLLLNWDIE